jgi:diphosphomevalonate decarboxylase
LNLPTNSSLSVTLSQDDLRTHTIATCSKSYKAEDLLILNGQAQDVSGARTQACFRELRSLRKQLEEADSSLPPLSTYPLQITSENNFPTAAGLASSAAGFAALVRAIADLYKLPQSPTDLSRIARQGSGSACRSLFGGYVAWEMGSKADGSDSLAVQIAPASHWPDMRALVLVVSAEKKGVSSTTGMQATVQTSTLYAIRTAEVVPKRMKDMIQAVKDKDFPSFAQLTMRDSNSFHATCLDTDPPIFYMNDVSRAAIKIVEGINAKAGKLIAAYTFDAGPNAVIYFLEGVSKEVVGTFKAIVGTKEGWPSRTTSIAAGEITGLDERAVNTLKDGVSRVIYTSVGEGPVNVTDKAV